MVDDIKQNESGTSETSNLERTGMQKSCYYNADDGSFFDDDNRLFDFKFFPKEAKFVTSEGIDITFRRVNLQTVANYSTAYRKKYDPEMPRRAIEYDEKAFYLEGNDKDTWYIKECDKYESEFAIATTAFQVSLTVKNKLPARKEWNHQLKTVIASLEELTDKPLTDHRIRYEWVNLMLPDNTELATFLKILYGMELPTMEGIAEAEERFPSASGSE